MQRKEKHNGCVWAAGIILLLAALVVGASAAYAWFHDGDEVINWLSIAQHDTELREEFEPPQKLEANSEIKKRVTVENTGTDACWVRVFCEFTNSEAAAFAALDYNEEAWERHGDFWYYKSILQPGDQTEPLITAISIGDAGAQELDSFEVLVSQESVQAKKTDGTFADMAAAWKTVNVEIG